MLRQPMSRDTIILYTQRIPLTKPKAYRHLASPDLVLWISLGAFGANLPPFPIGFRGPGKVLFVEGSGRIDFADAAPQCVSTSISPGKCQVQDGKN